MADKRGLQIIGFIFGAITMAVVSIAAVGLVNARDGGFDDTAATLTQSTPDSR